jgi:aminoglycoside phosphotransferase (APT) family kinase protein
VTDVVQSHADADGLERPPLVIIDGLAAQMPGEGPLRIQPLGAGHSNLTFTVQRGDRTYVLRRPPRPPIAPRAHDVAREFRMLQALGRHAVRVPAPTLLCVDEAAIGAPFYLMEKVDGVVIRDRVPAPLDTRAGRRRISTELVDALVELHAVPWESSPDLSAFGDGDEYLRRQLKLWARQWERNRTRAVPAVDVTRELLEQRLPESGRATVVHGDYKLDNVLFAASAPARLVAVLDWEMATIGDPLADLGYLLATWREAGDGPDDVLDFSPVTRETGFLDRAGLAAYYAERSGRCTEAIGWYEAFALWKLAIILEGLYQRHVAGASDDPFLGRLDAGVPRLADWARRRLDGR